MKFALPGKLNFSCLLLAAGDSTRMLGANKLLLPVGGQPLVRRTLGEILSLPFLEVVVVTGFEKPKIEEALHGCTAHFAFNADFQSGLHSTIRVGLFTQRRDLVSVIYSSWSRYGSQESRGNRTQYRS